MPHALNAGPELLDLKRLDIFVPRRPGYAFRGREQRHATAQHLFVFLHALDNGEAGLLYHEGETILRATLLAACGDVPGTGSHQ